MLKTLIFAACLLVANSAIAQENITYQSNGKTFEIREDKKLKYGDLKIVIDEDSFEYDVLFNSKSIFPRTQLEDEYKYSDYSYYIQKVYYINDKEVVLIRRSLGGTGTIDSYFFITLAAGSKLMISDFFVLGGLGGVENSSAKLIGNQIVFEGINVPDDFENRNILLRKVVYENGKISRVRSKVNIQDETFSCKNLYDTYKDYLKNDCGIYNSYNDVCMSGEMGISTSCRDYFGGFDEKKLAKAAKLACKNNSTINFTKFKLQVCGLK